MFYTALVILAVSMVLADRFGGNSLLHASYDSDDDYEGAYQLEASGESFNRVSVSGNFQVLLKESSDSYYHVQADGKHKEKIKAYVSGETLYIKFKGKKWFSRDFRKQVTVEIETPKLEHIEMHGAVSVETENTLHTDHLEIHMSGAGEGDFDIEAQTLDLHASGASEIELKGEVEDCTLRVSGAGELDADELKSKHMEVSISGAGEAKVYTTESLRVNVSGAGSVRYKGDPSEISKNISGAGSVKSM